MLGSFGTTELIIILVIIPVIVVLIVLPIWAIVRFTRKRGGTPARRYDKGGSP